MGLITSKKTVGGIDLVSVKNWPEPELDQSNQRNHNTYCESLIGDAIDEPPPVNPIPDRKDELLGDTIDIEEYIKMTDTPIDNEPEMTADEADEIEQGLQRDEAAEDEVND